MMTEQGSTRKISRHAMAFIAAGLFYLAGVLEMATSLHSRQNASMGLGAMFVCIGSLWVVIGAKYKKETGRSS